LLFKPATDEPQAAGTGDEPDFLLAALTASEQRSFIPGIDRPRLKSVWRFCHSDGFPTHPKARRNTSLPNLGIARSGNKEATKRQQTGNMFPVHFHFVVTLLPHRCLIVSIVFPLRFRHISNLCSLKKGI